MSLARYGWNETWAQRFEASGFSHGTPARVIAEHRELFHVHTGSAELPARVSGRLRHEAPSLADLPATGDWVVIEQADEGSHALIHAVLPRVSKFSRKAAGTRTDEQVVAANVDTVWIVSAFGSDLNPARIDRYLALAWESGASPVVVLNKADLSEAPDLTVAELGARAVGAPTHAVSALEGSGLDSLRGYLGPGQTIALLGSSGTGKSTLVNRLAGEEVMRVRAVRSSDGKGRHTTTHRQLVLLPSGALLLDTPGMRELQLWTAEAGLDVTFGDVEALAAECRFADCRHEQEPGCEVRAAIEREDLAQERLDSYRKLQRELAFLERKIDTRAQLEEKRRVKGIMRNYRRTLRDKG